MKRFLSNSFIVLALVVSAAGAAPAAHAGLLPEGNACPQGSFWISDRDRCEYGDESVAALVTEDQAVAQEAAATASRTEAEKATAAAQTAAAAKTPAAFEGTPQMDGVFAKIMFLILSLFSWLLTAAMITLNYAVYYTVVKMGDYVHGLAAIGVTWRILRDIANIMLIFGFLGAGIMTILNTEVYGWSTKMLPKLLVAAVFLNFSLFITEAMIDGTNLVATQFYTQINGGTMPTKDTLLNEGISGKIMQQLGFQTMYDVRKAPDTLKATNSLFVAFMGIILFIVTAFVMFSLAFVLIARFVALIFFIILSPVAFMGWAVPWLKYRMDQWWKNFLEQIITAPVLLLLLYVALAVITDAQFLAFGSSPNWLGLNPYSSTPANMAGFAGALLSFLIAMGLLLMVVIKAKSMSAFGAAGAIKLGGKLSFGATAFGLRSTAGWASNKIGRGLRNTRIGNRIATVPILGTNLTKAFEGIGKSSFDLRGTGALKNIGIDAGKAQEGGWNKWEEEKIKARMEYAKGFKGRELSKGEGDTASNAETERDSAQKSVNATKAVLEEDKKSLDRLDKDLERMKRMQEGMSEQDSRYEKLTQDIIQKEKEKTTVETRFGERNTAHETAKLALTEAEKKLTAASNANKDIERGATAQRKYAQNLTPQWLGKWGNYVINPYRNTQATKKILTEAKKSKSDKDMDKIKKLLEDSEKKESGGGEKKEEKKPEAPAPKPAS